MEIESIQLFIKSFIQPSARLRKNHYTHISYITETLNRVLSKHFAVVGKLDPEEVAKMFRELGFTLFESVNEMWGYNNKFYKTVWINVDTKDVRLLRLSTSIPSNTGKEKKLEVQELINRLDSFKDERL